MVLKERGLWDRAARGASGLNPSQPLTLSLLMSPCQVPHLENGIIVSELVLQQMLDNP